MSHDNNNITGIGATKPVPESRKIKRTCHLKFPLPDLCCQLWLQMDWYDHVPPLLGTSWVSEPIQIEVSPLIKTISFPLMVMLSVGSEWQWVRASTKTNETLPFKH